jgi:dephospho-CoA kinase
MKIIGLIGGIASGKSFVAQILRELGAEVIDADRLGHEVLRLPEVIEAAQKRWGHDVLGADGQIDRPALARKVFPSADAQGQPDAERRYLEELTHPRIGQLALARLAELASRPVPVPAVVFDVPLLLKAGWNQYCDCILFVDATRETRLARARARGWSEQEFDAREAAQESLDEKRAIADAVVANDGSPAQTRAQVEQFWQTLSSSRSADPAAS